MSTDGAAAPAMPPPVGGAEKARRSLEDMSKEELLTMMQRLKAHAQASAAEKAAAEEALARSDKEKSDLKDKAMALLKRCRDLEQQSAGVSPIAPAAGLADQLQQEKDANAQLLQKVHELNGRMEQAQIQADGLSEAYRAKVLEAAAKADEAAALQKQLDEVKEQSRGKMTAAVAKLKELKEAADGRAVEAQAAQTRVAVLEQQLASATASTTTAAPSAASEAEALREQHKAKMAAAVDKLREFKDAVDGLKEGSAAKDRRIEELEQAAAAARLDADKYKAAMDKVRALSVPHYAIIAPSCRLTPMLCVRPQALPRFKDLKAEADALRERVAELEAAAAAATAAAQERVTAQDALDQAARAAGQLQEQQLEEALEARRAEAGASRDEVASLLAAAEAQRAEAAQREAALRAEVAALVAAGAGERAGADSSGELAQALEQVAALQVQPSLPAWRRVCPPLPCAPSPVLIYHSPLALLQVCYTLLEGPVPVTSRPTYPPPRVRQAGQAAQDVSHAALAEALRAAETERDAWQARAGAAEAAAGEAEGRLDEARHALAAAEGDKADAVAAAEEARAVALAAAAAAEGGGGVEEQLRLLGRERDELQVRAVDAPGRGPLRPHPGPPTPLWPRGRASCWR